MKISDFRFQNARRKHERRLNNFTAAAGDPAEAGRGPGFSSASAAALVEEPSSAASAIHNTNAGSRLKPAFRDAEHPGRANRRTGRAERRGQSTFGVQPGDLERKGTDKLPKTANTQTKLRVNGA